MERVAPSGEDWTTRP